MYVRNGSFSAPQNHREWSQMSKLWRRLITTLVQFWTCRTVTVLSAVNIVKWFRNLKTATFLKQKISSDFKLVNNFGHKLIWSLSKCERRRWNRNQNTQNNQRTVQSTPFRWQYTEVKDSISVYILNNRGSYVSKALCAAKKLVLFTLISSKHLSV